jgi:hypothetical protein
MRQNIQLPAFVVLTALLLFAGCGASNDGELSPTGNVSEPRNVSMNKDDYPVFPDADAGADPAVPAEQGGKGFTGEGWETNIGFDLIGDPRAIKGGAFRDSLPDFPSTFRMEGPEANSQFNYGITAHKHSRVHAVAGNALADFSGQDDLPVQNQSEC